MMQLIDEYEFPEEQSGKLAKIQNSETIYVIWEVNEIGRKVHLVELDRPQDGDMIVTGLYSKSIYVLEPLEVIENVTEW